MPPLTLSGVSKPLTGSYSPPGDKSISHRAVMFASLGSGTSRVRHFLNSEDCLSTLKAFEAMGVKTERPSDMSSGTLVIHGAGLNGLSCPFRELDLGNSGTSMRLLMGILAGQRFEAVLKGDDSLSSRPMGRVTKPLKMMGAQIKGAENGNFAPLQIRGGRLKAIEYVNELGSAQVKSAILFAGMYAEGTTKVEDPLFCRDHTERFLKSCGARFLKRDRTLFIEKTDRLDPFDIHVPGDMSSAAFFITAAAMTPGSVLTVENVSLNPTRTGILPVLKRMGARIEVNKTNEEPEPIGIVRVTGARLKGTRIGYDEVPSLIDELPVLMTAMALAEGESIISGAKELRVKETDRIMSMAQNLNEVGGRVEELADGCIIRGVDKFHGGSVKSFGDHRTVMSMVVATLAMSGELVLDDIGSVNTSYPNFFHDWDSFFEK